MDDTIDLAAMFMTPTVALREARRCDELAATFRALASDRYHTDPVSADALARMYAKRAGDLYQIAKPTAARIQSA